ncbi:MAG: sulfate adenylyltransferase, partial [SAR324 cluster bacterium]|nr:sulfate adenylyltransferase [SAR324 cluster bacterium]
MIKPFGSEILTPLFVKDESRRKMLLEEAENIPSIVVSSAAVANAVMLGGGYFNPLNAYMNLSDVLAVAEGMQMSSGLMWPTPVINLLKGNSLTEELKSATKIALRDPNVEGNPVIAIQSIEK